MKLIFTLLLIIFSFFTTIAQPPPGAPRPPFPGGERIKALKIGMIADRTELTEKQAEKFWPIYNAYSAERISIHKQIRALTSKTKGFSEEELMNRQDEILDLKQKEILVVKKYRESFLKVISPKQYAKMMEAEAEFNVMLLDKLKERKERD